MVATQLTAGQARALNEALFAKLEASPMVGMIEPISCYLRSLMYHKFTRMPKRGFFHRIVAPNVLLTAAEVVKLGENLADCDPWTGEIAGVKETRYTPWWGGGQLLYEVIEGRLDREDFQRRLAARTVPRYEWKSRYGLARMGVRNRDGTPSDYLRRKLRTEKFVDGLLMEIAGLVLAIAERNHGQVQDREGPDGTDPGPPAGPVPAAG